jgi:serine protease Do
MFTVSCLLLAALLQEGLSEVHLSSGALVRGTLVKETAEELFLDVGHTILAVPRSAVLRVESVAPKTGAASTSSGSQELYRTAERPAVSVHENVLRVGRGVVLVRVPGALGSGFVINAEGYVVTNAHVVEGEQNVSVTIFEPAAKGQGLEKRVVEGVEILALNPYWDLALLRLPEAALAGLPLEPIPFGTFEALEIGEPVFAIGNPLGLERSVSEGIVSTKNRAHAGMLYVQTTAAINPGNSGGPLFNLKGEMVGVTTWGYLGAEGLNFAIPVSVVRTFLENREAFAYDRDQPNSGHRYLRPPRKGQPGD